MRIPLAVTIGSRSASLSQDSRLVNALIETQGQRRKVRIRPGLSQYTIIPSLPVSTAQGIYFFQSAGWYIVILNNTVYKVTTGGTSSTLGTVVAGTYSFSETDGATTGAGVVFFQNGTNGYYYNNKTATFGAITDVNFPPNQTPSLPLVPGMAYLDDQFYVMTNTGAIYNPTNQEDPTVWNALNFITKFSEPDTGIALVKHLSYVLAFGLWSGEFFFDNFNATGSPLARNDTVKMEIGCSNANSVVRIQTQQTVIWIGQSRETGNGVYRLDGLSPKKISSPEIDQYLDADSLTSVRAFAVTVKGHPLYILSLISSNITFVYDLHENEWYQWTSDNGAGVENRFQYDFFASEDAAFGNNNSLLLHATNGTISNLSTTVYQDNGVQINFRIVTPNIDFDSYANKFMFSAELIGDSPSVDGIVSIRHTDDDYKTWSPYRTVTLSNKRPIIYQLGYFKRRAFDIWSTSNTAIRLEFLELSVEKGEGGN